MRFLGNTRIRDLPIEDHGKFFPEEGYLVCKDGRRDEWELFREKQKSITDGQRNKELFDCKRALWGYHESSLIKSGRTLSPICSIMTSVKK